MARVIFEPFVQPWWLMLWAAAALTLSAFHYRRQLAGLMRPRLRWLLLWLEWAAIAMFVAYAANLQLERSHPDPGACRIAVLVDGSESMHSCNDMPDGRSRWQAAVAAAEIFHSRNGGQCEVRQFGGSAFPAVPWPLDDADASPPLPGGTDLAAAIQSALAEEGTPGVLPWGAMVIVGDGRHNASDDDAVIAAARRARELGIPVSTLCLGGGGRRRRTELKLESPRLMLEAGQGGSAFATIHNRTDATRKIRLVMSEECAPSKDAPPPPLVTALTLSANESRRVELPIPAAERPGERIFRLAAGADGTVRFFRVEDHPPRRCRILYLGNGMSWQWRFLRLANQSRGDAMRLSAVIALPQTEERWQALPPDFRPQRRFWSMGGADECWPQNAAALARYDVVVVECGVAAAMGSAAQQAIADFATAGGGGVLFTGAAELLPETLARLCPGRKFGQRTAGDAQPPLLTDDLIYSDGASRDAIAQEKLLPRGSAYFFCAEADLLSRTIMADQHGNAVLMARSAGNAGRAVWCGLEESWRWCLEDAGGRGTRRYRIFWNTLLEWLATNRVKPLETLTTRESVVAGSEVELSVRVHDEDFSPAENATVHAVLTAPDATVRYADMPPSGDEPGGYSCRQRLDAPGVWHVRYESESRPGLPVRYCDTSLIVVPDDRENAVTAANFPLMAAVARISGGETLTPGKMDGALPMKASLPQLRRRTPLAGHVPFALLMAALLAAVWHLRRRNGAC